MTHSRYADDLMHWLKELGYSHCFFLAGGGSMHLVDAASKVMKCIPVVHEVTAVIAAEYFNDTSATGEKAFALVTTGPGLTNTVTGIAGAWLESRSLLILAGQVKVSDLKSGSIRQRGIQEVDGIAILKPITKCSLRITAPIPKEEFQEIVLISDSDRPGPVLIEVCIDISAKPTDLLEYKSTPNVAITKAPLEKAIPSELNNLMKGSQRPLVLLGGGTRRDAAEKFLMAIAPLGIPVACTWGGADRVSSDYPHYAGRPNTYGMRWANIFQQQSDLLIAVGTSLGLQQTGFNWEEFVPVGKIVHINIDESELKKGHPRCDLSINMDSSYFLDALADLAFDVWKPGSFSQWSGFLEDIRHGLPVIESCHDVGENYVDPYKLIYGVSQISQVNDIITPCSSGGTYTAFNQAFVNHGRQKITSNKGLASMGYGLAGAIGASISNPNNRILHFEGDGGFLQNLQDLATVKQNNLNIKMFVICNDGYASIRTSQKSYFNGNYVGCDTATGLGMPQWEEIFSAFGINYSYINPTNYFDSSFYKDFDSSGSHVFIVQADPSQLYMPKVASKINSDGSMSSAAIHDMSPKLSQTAMNSYFRYLPKEFWGNN